MRPIPEEVISMILQYLVLLCRKSVVAAPDKKAAAILAPLARVNSTFRAEVERVLYGSAFGVVLRGPAQVMCCFNTVAYGSRGVGRYVKTLTIHMENYHSDIGPRFGIQRRSDDGRLLKGFSRVVRDAFLTMKQLRVYGINMGRQTTRENKWAPQFLPLGAPFQLRKFRCHGMTLGVSLVRFLKEQQGIIHWEAPLLETKYRIGALVLPNLNSLEGTPGMIRRTIAGRPVDDVCSTMCVNEVELGILILSMQTSTKSIRRLVVPSVNVSVIAHRIEILSNNFPHLQMIDFTRGQVSRVLQRDGMYTIYKSDPFINALGQLGNLTHLAVFGLQLPGLGSFPHPHNHYMIAENPFEAEDEAIEGAFGLQFEGGMDILVGQGASDEMQQNAHAPGVDPHLNLVGDEVLTANTENGTPTPPQPALTDNLPHQNEVNHHQELGDNDLNLYPDASSNTTNSYADNFAPIDAGPHQSIDGAPAPLPPLPAVNPPAPPAGIWQNMMNVLGANINELLNQPMPQLPNPVQPNPVMAQPPPIHNLPAAPQGGFIWNNLIGAAGIAPNLQGFQPLPLLELFGDNPAASSSPGDFDHEDLILDDDEPHLADNGILDGFLGQALVVLAPPGPNFPDVQTTVTLHFGFGGPLAAGGAGLLPQFAHPPNPAAPPFNLAVPGFEAGNGPAEPAMNIIPAHPQPDLFLFGPTHAPVGGPPAAANNPNDPNIFLDQQGILNVLNNFGGNPNAHIPTMRSLSRTQSRHRSQLERLQSFQREQAPAELEVIELWTQFCPSLSQVKFDMGNHRHVIWRRKGDTWKPTYVAPPYWVKAARAL